jgi:hypothetical protein
MDVQMWRIARARVPHPPNCLSFSNALPRPHVDAAALEMGQKDIVIAATQQHVIACDNRHVGHRNRHIGLAIERLDNGPCTWRQNGCSKKPIATGVSWREPIGLKSPAIDRDDIDAIALAPI